MPGKARMGFFLPRSIRRNPAFFLEKIFFTTNSQHNHLLSGKSLLELLEHRFFFERNSLFGVNFVMSISPIMSIATVCMNFDSMF